jgi:hypothetical protein
VSSTLASWFLLPQICIFSVYSSTKVEPSFVTGDDVFVKWLILFQSDPHRSLSSSPSLFWSGLRCVKSGCWNSWVMGLGLIHMDIKPVLLCFSWPLFGGLVVGQNFSLQKFCLHVCTICAIWISKHNEPEFVYVFSHAVCSWWHILLHIVGNILAV